MTAGMTKSNGMSQQVPIEHPSVSTWLTAGLCLLAFILLGHFGLFRGETFFVEEDPVAIFEFAANNSVGNGWTPGEGLGTSHFYGDPGAHHVWGPWSLWPRLFSDQVTAYNASIVLLLLAAAVAQFALIRRVAPVLTPVPSLLLSTLIVFGSLRYEFFFQRHWIMLTVGGPLGALVLHDFYLRPRAQHYFQYAAILFCSLVLGSVMSLLELMMLGAVIYACLWRYHRREPVQHEGAGWARGLSGFLLLNLAAALTVVALAAWEGYSIVSERLAVGYVRDAKHVVISLSTMFSWPGLRAVAMKLIEYWHAGVLSPWMMTPGLAGQFSLPMASWNNVSPLMPVVLLVALRQPRATFWEFACKRIVLLFFLYEMVLLFVPGLMSPLEALLKVYHFGKFQPAYQPFEAALIAMLLTKAPGCWNVRAARLAAGTLAAVYGALFLLTLLARLGAGMDKADLTTLLETALTFLWSSPGDTAAMKSFILSVLSVNVTLFGAHSGTRLAFYGLTCLCLGLMAAGLWPSLARTRAWTMAALFAGVNVLLAWSVYPLNQEPLVWDMPGPDGRRAAELLSPTDRLARVGVKPCWSREGESDRLVCYQTRLYAERDRPRRYQVGYRLVPTMDFTAVKSFTQTEETTFTTSLLREEGVQVRVLRLLQMNPVLYRSLVFDMAAVKYLVTDTALDPSETLRLVYQGQQLYLYENVNAWPYFYVANRIGSIERYTDLLGAQRGDAYLWSQDAGPEARQWQGLGGEADVSIQMTLFKPGEMEFGYRAGKDALLVVADAWHPRWTASIDKAPTRLLKANGVFKSVVLSEGEHVLRLQFDTAPYRAGIVISVMAGILFLAGWIFCAMRDSRARVWTRPVGDLQPLEMKP